MGTPKNDVQSRVWYQMGADKGSSRCMYRLGLFYERLKGYKEAFEWFKKGAKNDTNAKLKLTKYDGQGNRIAPFQDCEEI